MEQAIRDFILDLGVDDVGFARAGDYNSPKSDPVAKFLPDAKAIVVLAFRALSSCESPSWSAALNGYMDLAAFARSASYRTARFLESRYGAKVVSMPHTFPFEIRYDRRAVAEFSQRHAAVAAGLGSFGRHNLVIHPRFGTRVKFASIVTDLELAPSPRSGEDYCLHCGLCVQNCPSGALDEAGRTDVMKCMKHSQPYGLGADIAFWTEVAGGAPAEQQALLRSERYARLRLSAHLGNQYMCFNCLKSCPVGVGGR